MKRSPQLSHMVTSSFLAGILLVSAVWVGVAAMPAAVAQETQRTLTVTGRGRESVTTTRAKVSLGVEISGKTADEVQREVVQRANAVVELLRSQNVDQLETTGIRLNPQYRYDNGRSELVGYMGSNTVSFEVPTEAAGELIDAAVEAGATQVQGIEFIAEDSAIAAAQDVALQAATQAARRQAEAVFESLGFSAQEIVSIQIDGARTPMPIPAGARLEAASADVSSPVIGGEQTVEASVTLQIRY